MSKQNRGIYAIRVWLPMDKEHGSVPIKKKPNDVE